MGPERAAGAGTLPGLEPVGIDLGTSTSVVAAVRNGRAEALVDPSGRRPLVPSVLALDRRGKTVVGHVADRDGRVPNVIRESKRGMAEGKFYRLGETAIPAARVASTILVKMLDVAEEQLGVRPETAVVTVPAAFGDAARRATLSAATQAGLKTVRLLSEPVAAAIAYGSVTEDARETIVVVDFGGGTLDVSLVDRAPGEIGVVASFGDDRLGGKDFDADLAGTLTAGFLKDRPGRTITDLSADRLLHAAREAKETLSAEPEATIHVENFSGEDALEATIDRATFERLIAPRLERMTEVVEETLRKAGRTVAQVDRVLLVGGTTYVPAVVRRLKETLGKTPEAAVDRDCAVALGAAIAAANDVAEREFAEATVPAEIERPRPLTIRDVATFGVGVLVIKSIEGKGRLRAYDELIAPNAPIPHSVTRRYALSSPTQATIELEVVQDPTGRAVLPEDTLRSDTVARLTGIPPSGTGAPHSVDIEFSYDRDHRIHLQATVRETGQRVAVRMGDGPAEGPPPLA